MYVLPLQAEKMSYSSLLDVLILFPLAVIWAFLPNSGIAVVTHWFLTQVVETLVTLSYSRILEEEADSVGLHLMAKVAVVRPL